MLSRGTVLCQSPRVCEVERSGTERIGRRSVSADDPRSLAEWSGTNRGVWLSWRLRKGDDIDGGLPRWRDNGSANRVDGVTLAQLCVWAGGCVGSSLGRAGERGGCLYGVAWRALSQAGEGANPGLTGASRAPSPSPARRPRLAERPTLFWGRGRWGGERRGDARAARGGNGWVPPACGGEINAARDAQCSERSEQMLSL